MGKVYGFLLILLQIENGATADYTPPPTSWGEGKTNKLIQINRSPETEFSEINRDYLRMFFIFSLARTRCSRYNSSATSHSRDDHTIRLSRATTAGTRRLQRAATATRRLQRATTTTRRLLQPAGATRLQPPAGSVPRTRGGHGCKTLIYFPFI